MMMRSSVSRIITLVSAAVISASLTSGCSSAAKQRSEHDMIVVDKKSDRQVVAEFDGACAMSMAEGKYHIGDSKYVLQHNGKTYYFGSAEAKKKFEDHLDSNEKRATQNWINRTYSA